MARIKDLTGQKFGHLTAIRQYGRSGYFITWLCRCECGTEIIVRGTELSRGAVQSCGCQNKGRQKAPPPDGGIMEYGKSQNNPKCGWEHTDCFAFLDGCCTALSDASFPLREDCPFFKAAAQRRKELWDYEMSGIE